MIIINTDEKFSFGFSHAEIWSNNSYITFRCPATWSPKDNRNIYLVLQYTKFTDAEDSFDESMLEYVNGDVVYEEYANEDVTNAVNAIWS